MKRIQKLLRNSRFYILSLTLLVSLFVVAYFRILFPSDQLYYIRMEQLFGLLAAILIYVAVLITPLSKLVPKWRIIPPLMFARRGIGVSAAYLATLHGFIVLEKQIGGLGGLSLLPLRFKVSLALGFVAYLVIFAMAATSLDKAIEIMTFRRWKQLHRFVYLAGVLIIVHVWLIGTHVEYRSVRFAVYAGLGVLLALEVLRLSKSMTKKYKLSNQARYPLLVLFGAVALLGLILLPRLEQQYHSAHSATTPDTSEAQHELMQMDTNMNMQMSHDGSHL